MKTYTGKYSGAEARERNTLARYDQLVLELEDGSEIAFPGSRQYVQEQSQGLTPGEIVSISVDETNIWSWSVMKGESDMPTAEASYNGILKLSQNDEGMEILAINNSEIIEIFFSDNVRPRRTRNLRIECERGGWALVNHATPIAYRDDADNFYFNEMNYSHTTNLIQHDILYLASNKGIIMDVVDNEHQLREIMDMDSKLAAPVNVKVINVREEEGKYIVEYQAEGVDYAEKEVGPGLLKDMNIRELEKYIETPPDRDFTAMRKNADGSSTTPLYEATCPEGHKFEVTPGEIAMAGGAVCPKCGKKCTPKYKAKSIRERAQL